VARAARRKLRQLEATLATGLPTEVRKQLQGQAAEVRAVLDQVEGEAQATEVAARQLGLQESQQRLAEAADALARNPSPGNQRRHEAAQLEVTKAKVRLKRVTAALNPSGGNQPPEGGQPAGQNTDSTPEQPTTEAPGGGQETATPTEDTPTEPPAEDPNAPKNSLTGPRTDTAPDEGGDQQADKQVAGVVAGVVPLLADGTVPTLDGPPPAEPPGGKAGAAGEPDVTKEQPRTARPRTASRRSPPPACWARI
jgi:hypothetical protein